MRRRLACAPKALGDLDDTEVYTRRTWGDAQAKRYVAALITAIGERCGKMESRIEMQLAESFEPLPSDSEGEFLPLFSLLNLLL